MEQPGKVANGPYLQAAFFCERLLEEADGVLSAIRIVDTVTIHGDEQSVQPAAIPVNLTMFIAFKAGEARGNYELTVAMKSPSVGSSPHPTERHKQTVHFHGGEDRGINIIMPIAMTVDEEGVYWFAIYLGERLVTRLPLRVAVLRQMPQSHAQ